jgi:hypothetical protein
MRAAALCAGITALVALITSACGSITGTSGRAPDQDFQNFVALAERAQEEGFTAYWLGRSFDAGGLTFEGPSVADFGADVTGGGST